ncbi:PRC-barrel domain-containing protein [Streptomyces sp. I05A-00742]|uniref:PRC-barrel domain-containing protein n=1 Tax=Streptomyces sp. I05A-00742 TaxID=2732853 RepID=UPI001487E98F|nr:PRC-barrel domain-containing protein [Streptomyces sp. I05A-00742]
MQSDIDPRSLIGRKAYDRDGSKIGTVDEVYLDDATGEPEWAAVRTGLFGRDAFVPLEPSEVVGEALRIPYDRALIKAAPDLGVGRHLSPEQELQLYHHYRLTLPGPAGDNGSGTGQETAPPAEPRGAPERGHDTGPEPGP